METIKDRLIAFKDSLGMRTRPFEESCGLSNGYIRGLKNMTSDKLESILQNYPQLNRVWLLTGEGNMLNDDSPSQPTTPMVDGDPTGNIRFWHDVSATGGDVQFLENPSEHHITMHNLPNFRDCTDAVTLYGDSMTPLYRSGEIIILKRWEESFIDYGHVYLIVTKNGHRMVKTLMPADDDALLRCESANPNYPAFNIKKSDVIRLFLVRGRLAVDTQ